MTLAKEIQDLQSDEPYMYVDECVEILEHPIVKGPWISGTTRWSIVRSMVVDYNETFYQVVWHTPATEYQEGADDQNQWTLTRVEPVERLVTEYERVREG